VEKMKYLNKTIEDQIFDEIYLEPYSTDDLYQIMEFLANKKGFHIHDSCKRNLENYIDTQRKASGFLNSIALNRYLETAKKRLADRFVDTESEMDEKERIEALWTFMPEDFETESDQNVKELYEKLLHLHGLKTVKAEVKQQMDRIKVDMIARQAGASGNDKRGTLHTIYMGDPGTGKTTVAEIVGKIYCAMGLLPKGNQKITTVSRADLVAPYLGQTARQVKEVCERSDGGVLFIDEAYSLYNSSNDTFGKEAVDTLIQELENRRDSMMIILAGYENEMEEFLKTNPGFKSRVPNVIHFDNYDVADMVSIFEEMMVKENFYWKDLDAPNLVTNLIEVKSKEPDFGNARGVRNLYEKVKSIQRGRLGKELEEFEKQGNSDMNSLEYDVFTKEDIQSAHDSILKESKSIEELLEELNGLTGLEGVKHQVADMVNSMNYIKLAKSRNIDLGRNQGTLHMVFSGNPGTGKTTVAKFLGEIYVKLGVLKKSTFIQAERSDLIGQYQGHTAQLVANKAAEADGGILFIDEAYQLCLDEHDTFGNEAVGTLLSLVEEKRDSLMVILAGYSDDMETFLRTNPGLRSRFPNVIEFTDYTLDEMVEIFVKNCQKESMVLEEGVELLVKNQIERHVEKNQREFANARGVRNLMDQIIVRQRSRIVRENADGKVHTDEDFLMIKKEDIIVSK
jgi:SpoVK/Ycf46/Vps4 family AAA+-type ATPase